MFTTARTRVKSEIQRIYLIKRNRKYHQKIWIQDVKLKRKKYDFKGKNLEKEVWQS